MQGHSFGSRNNVATRHNPCKHGFCSHCSVVSECNIKRNLVFRRFFEPAAIIGRCFLSQIAHARDSSRKLDSPLAYSRFSASYNKSLLINCSTFKQKHYEKQRTLENGDSVRHIDSDGSTDCHEYDIVHGSRADNYLKASPRICGDSLLLKYQSLCLLFLLF